MFIIVTTTLYISDQPASVLSHTMENIPSAKKLGAAEIPVPSKSPGKPSPSVQAKGRKVKTEAANPYLQYLSERKRQFCILNPKGVVNVKSVLKDWRNLSDEERNVYIEKFKIDRELLGDAYRHGRKRKEKDENERKLKKKNIEISVQGSGKDDEISVDVQTIDVIKHKPYFSY